MPTLLKLGVDTGGGETKLEKFANSLDKVGKSLGTLDTSAKGSQNAVKTAAAAITGLSEQMQQAAAAAKSASNVMAGFKSTLDSLWSSGNVSSGLKDFVADINNVSTNLKEVKKDLVDFINTSGKYAEMSKVEAQATYEMSAALRAQEQTITSLLGIEGAYVSALSKETLLNEEAAISLQAKTAAINANVAAYGKLVTAGTVAGGSYDKGRNYAQELSSVERLLSLEKQMAMKESEMAKMKAANSKEISSALKEEQAARAAIVSSVEKQFFAEQDLIERNRKAREQELAQLKKINAEKQAAASTVSSYTQTGRSRLAAGTTAGRYDYAQAIKDEAKLYDSQGRLKTGLSRLSAEWEIATGKTKVFHSVVRGVTGATGQLWLSYGKGAKEIAAIAAAYGTVAVAIKSIKLGAEFDTTTRTIQTLSDGSLKGAEGLELIRNKILGINDVVNTPQELATGLLELARAGEDVTSSLNNLEEVSRFATLSGIELGKAVELLVGQSKAFKDVDISQVANIIAKVADDTSVSISQMTEALKNTTELGTVMGANFLDVATSLGILADHGIRASSAGTSLRTSMLQLISPTNAAQVAMKKYFVEFTAIDPITGKVKDLHTMVSDLSKATSHLSSGELTIVLEKLTGNRSIKAIGALISAIREEEKILNSTSGAVEKHGKTWSEAREVYKRAMGEGVDAITYLKKITDELSESSGIQLKKLAADFERLGTKSVNTKAVAKAVKDLRDTINDPSMKSSLTFLLEIFTKLAEISFSSLSGLLVELRNWNDAVHGKVSFGQVLSADSVDEQKRLAKDIDLGLEELRESISKTETKIERLKYTLSNRRGYEGEILSSSDLAKVTTQLETAQYQLEGFKSTYDKVTQAKNLPDALGLSKKEIDEAIKAAEARVKTLSKMVETGKAPIGWALTNEGVEQARIDLAEATKHLNDLKSGYKTASVTAEEYADTTSNVASSVAADIERMSEEVSKNSLTNLQKWETQMLEARDNISAKMIDPSSDKYEPKMGTESTEQYLSRIAQLADQWDSVNRSLHENERLKAKALDLKPANDTLKQMESNKAALESSFMQEKRLVESLLQDNEDAYSRGLKNYNTYLAEKNQLTIRALNSELVIKEQSVREAEESLNKFTSGMGGGVDGDEELTGKQLQLQKELYTANKEVADIKGQIILLQKKSVSETDKELNAYQSQMLSTQAELLSIQGEITGSKTLTYEATLKQLEAEATLLKFGDAELNKFKMLVIEYKKLEANGLNTFDSIRAGLNDVRYTTKEMSDDIRAATSSAFDSMTDSLVEFVTTGKTSFSDLVNSILADLARIAIKNSITDPLANALGGLLSFSDFSSSVSTIFSRPGLGNYGLTATGGARHGGGTIGYDAPTFTRQVSIPQNINSVPRYHSGLMSDEFLTILQKGETVLTRDQQQVIGSGLAAKSGGDVYIDVINNSSSAQTTQKSYIDGRGQRRVELTIADAVSTETARSGSTLNSTIKGTFGLTQRMIGR